MLVDYHLHIERGPYTLEWLQKFIDQGTNRGVLEFGFSEHCYRFKQAAHLSDLAWHIARCTVDLDEYVALITAAKASGLPVKLGLEIDYFPEKEQLIREFVNSYPFDFVIGSVHWLGDWGFDLEETLPRWQEADIDQVYREYFSTIQQAATSKIFTNLGHLDLVKIFGYRPSEDMRELFDEVIKTIAASGCVVEVSTAGLRKKVGEIYPQTQILKLCRQYNVPITLSSDAHEPQQVGENFSIAVDYITKLGINSLATVSNMQVTLHQIDIK
jgi:histidinol-phosphatase (PHP family)